MSSGATGATTIVGGEVRRNARADAIRLARAVVTRVLFHTKELLLVTASEDGDVRLWDLVGQACIATLKVTFWQDTLQLVILAV